MKSLVYAGRQHIRATKMLNEQAVCASCDVSERRILSFLPFKSEFLAVAFRSQFRRCCWLREQ